MENFAMNHELNLRQDIGVLAGSIGERNIYCYSKLLEAEDYIEHRFLESDLKIRRQEYEAKGHVFANIEATVRGAVQPNAVFVVGAHYDTHRGSPGANDNSSGVAALLTLGEHLAARRPACTIRLVAFTNEERPFLRTRKMGSRVYAQRCRARGEKIVGMLSLETIGYCSEERGSQKLSLFGRLLPRRGNFLAMVSNRTSRPLLRQTASTLQPHLQFRIKTVALPGAFPGARSSDQWSFWKEGYPALMLTDTAPLRYPFYHLAEDTPDKLCWEFLGGVVRGLGETLEEIKA